MAYEQRDLTGSLFKNDRKEADTHPDYKGTAKVEGVEYWLDAWINETSSGDKYMSLKLKAKEARTATPGTKPLPAAAGFDDDSSVPF